MTETFVENAMPFSIFRSVRVHVCACVCVCACTCDVCLGVQRHAIDEAPELFHHRLDQLLLIPVVLPELGEDVVLLTGVLHPAGEREEHMLMDRSMKICLIN